MQLMLLNYHVFVVQCFPNVTIPSVFYKLIDNAAINEMSSKRSMIKYSKMNEWRHNLDTLLLCICGSAFLQC